MRKSLRAWSRPSAGQRDRMPLQGDARDAPQVPWQPLGGAAQRVVDRLDPDEGGACMSDSFIQVCRRAFGIARDGGDCGNCGPPNREPRDRRRVIVHDRVAHTIDDRPGDEDLASGLTLKTKTALNVAVAGAA